MPSFYYEAADRSGKKIKKELDAENAEEVRNLIRSEDLVPLRISLQKKKQINPFEKITTGDLLIFTQELQSLISSGMPLDKALFTLSEHSEKIALKKILKDIYSDIQKGQPLSKAMAKHRTFPNLYVNMVKAGEESGHLEPVLKRITDFLETTDNLKRELLSSLIYPIFRTIVGTVTMAILMLYVIPKFTVIFEDFEQAIPLPTQLLINLSEIFKEYWWLLSIILITIIVAARSYASTKKGRVFFDTVKLKAPLIKKLHMKLAIARFSRTMGTLLNSGVPILNAIRISKEVIGNSVISDKLVTLQEGVSKGKGIHNPLKEIGIFPHIVTQMIAIGEEAGTLEETFMLIADRFESDSRNMIKRLISFMEPAIILIMAVFVGFIVFSMLLAIVGLYDISL